MHITYYGGSWHTVMMMLLFFSHDDDDVAFHDRERGPPEGEECGESNQDINTHRLRADIVVMQY